MRIFLATALFLSLVLPSSAAPDANKMKMINEGVATSAFCTGAYISMAALMKMAADNTKGSEKQGYMNEANNLAGKAKGMDMIFGRIILPVAQQNGLDPATVVGTHDALVRKTLNDFKQKIVKGTAESVGAELAKAEENCDLFAKGILGGAAPDPKEPASPLSPNKGPA